MSSYPPHSVLHYYASAPEVAAQTQHRLSGSNLLSAMMEVVTVECELCYNIMMTGAISDLDRDILESLMQTTCTSRGLVTSGDLEWLVEVGPQLTFETAWSSNALAILRSASPTLAQSVVRIERSRVYRLVTSARLSGGEQQLLLSQIHDRMTEMVYTTPLTTFSTGRVPDAVTKIYILDEQHVKGSGSAALAEANVELGLGMDEWDIEYYTRVFTELGRNPTSVECFDVGQSNSEHSRHWFFGGKLVIDGEEMSESLFKMVKDTLAKTNGHMDQGGNSVIAFADNSSSMIGYQTELIRPVDPCTPSVYTVQTVDLDVCYTAETHNFPTGVAPFAGAETGIGGRLRDQHSTGAGSMVGMGTAGYCVGSLQVPEYDLAWEDKTWEYPENLASPLDILVHASNGASDYGNKFGEPICCLLYTSDAADEEDSVDLGGRRIIKKKKKRKRVSRRKTGK
eukprot:TRINITY_DN29209_c0_g1_i1.p1 TRINITY_DN29209_c0_g1~~TRINITY_DN29209_c0_g1_i1.p1  ORF type:complete len:454 (-),score=102.18 TRINITY_DN29209_c0_g1_i1:52-1413(-)